MSIINSADGNKSPSITSQASQVQAEAQKVFQGIGGEGLLKIAESLKSNPISIEILAATLKQQQADQSKPHLTRRMEKFFARQQNEVQKQINSYFNSANSQNEPKTREEYAAKFMQETAKFEKPDDVLDYQGLANFLNNEAGPEGKAISKNLHSIYGSGDDGKTEATAADLQNRFENSKNVYTKLISTPMNYTAKEFRETLGFLLAGEKNLPAAENKSDDTPKTRERRART